MTQPLSERIRETYLYTWPISDDIAREWADEVAALERQLRDVDEQLECADG